MYYADRNAPIEPRNGHTLIVGIVARISGCTNQKELSLDDQVDHGKEIVEELYTGPEEYRVIATKGKGENLERPELAELEHILRKGELDLLVLEDLGRLVRGAEAVRLLGIGVDHGTRTLSPNDCIDTAEASWEEDALSACRDHVGHNAHTSKRLKYKLMNRFLKFGGATALPIFGYIVPPEAQTYDDWQKDPTATSIILEGLQLLRTTRNYSAVADMFNKKNTPTGPYCRRKEWDGKMVKRFYHNSLLKGMPGRGFRHTVKHHESGKRKSVKNEKGPMFKDCPHLAHVNANELDEVVQLLDTKNKDKGRKPVNGVDPRSQVPKKRTRFPGQWSRCWYCGYPHVWGGNGITKNLMCSNAREWNCWNSIGFEGRLTAKRVVEAIMTELHSLTEFNDQFREMVQSAGHHLNTDRSKRWAALKIKEDAVTREKENIIAAVAAYGPKPMFNQKFMELELAEKELMIERSKLQSLKTNELHLPESISELRYLMNEQFTALAIDSPECGDLLRRIVPEVYVYLVRLCDGGHLWPRAKVTLALDGIASDLTHVPGASNVLTREITLDLFEPPQRERIRVEAVRLRHEGLSHRDIAQRIDENPTQPAVQNALTLHQKMIDLGLSSPYVLVMSPPADYPKLRRHKNPKYEFKPLRGYRRPPI